ncbi:hypothetical protein [Parasitella parasitica]|uniref:Uncharacterized protein n=1 Tax=Parasitella parasitica TaxID=35722 RepID=A0A0B7N8C7_9FUNG|nr:hypothetical protein [Parasitella parasitica]
MAQEQDILPYDDDGSVAGSSFQIDIDQAQQETTEHSLESAVAGLEAKIKGARKKLQDIHMFSGREYSPEAKQAADKIANDIEWYKKNFENSYLIVLQSIKPINLKDIPKFQIIGQAKRYPD